MNCVQVRICSGAFKIAAHAELPFEFVEPAIREALDPKSPRAWQDSPSFWNRGSFHNGPGVSLLKIRNFLFHGLTWPEKVYLWHLGIRKVLNMVSCAQKNPLNELNMNLQCTH